LAYVTALNAHDPDTVAALVTEDFVNEHTSSLGTSLVGRDAYRERLPGFLDAMSGLRYEVEDVIADGDRVALAYTLRAEYQGYPVVLRGMFRFTVRGGAIAHRIDYWDSAEFRRQIGEG
jgi:steroid delta-isomerase-like uncharacterized protein